MDVGFITRKMANDLNNINHRKIAIKEEVGKSMTYMDLHHISNAYANKLYELGVRKGDRVGILLYNCLEYFSLYFAIAKIGAIAVRLNFRLSSAELEYALNDSQTKILSSIRTYPISWNQFVIMFLLSDIFVFLIEMAQSQVGLSHGVF